LVYCTIGDYYDEVVYNIGGSKGPEPGLSVNDDYTDPLIESFRQIGFSVANGFDWKSLDEPTKKAWSVQLLPPIK
jgi:hypothetical protein